MMLVSEQKKTVFTSSLVVGVGGAAALFLSFLLLRELNSTAELYAAELAFDDVFTISKFVDETHAPYPAKMGLHGGPHLNYVWRRDTAEPLSYKLLAEPSTCEKIEGRKLIGKSSWTLTCPKGYDKNGQYWLRAVRQKTFVAEAKT